MYIFLNYLVASWRLPLLFHFCLVKNGSQKYDHTHPSLSSHCLEIQRKKQRQAASL